MVLVVTYDMAIAQQADTVFRLPDGKLKDIDMGEYISGEAPKALPKKPA